MKESTIPPARTYANDYNSVEIRLHLQYALSDTKIAKNMELMVKRSGCYGSELLVSWKMDIIDKVIACCTN